ncbi:MAG: hypothetical protein HXX19_18815, partial [Rhodoferax sp.]|nr:hypothetical protein [Rhodoferax sp.]
MPVPVTGHPASMANFGWRVLLLVGLALLLGGCAEIRPYRVSGEPCSIDLPDGAGLGDHDWEAAPGGGRRCADRWQVAATHPVPFSVNFVEIDEQGVLASRAQAEAAIA